MNGVAERVNQILVRMVIVVLVDSGLPAKLWELAMAQATQIHNKVPHKKLGMKSPFLLLHKREPCRKFIYRFGSIAYSLIPYAKQRTKKAEPNGEQVIYVGNRASSSLVMKVEERKIFQSSNITVTESLVFKDKYEKNIFENVGYLKFKLPKEQHIDSMNKYERLNFDDSLELITARLEEKNQPEVKKLDPIEGQKPQYEVIAVSYTHLTLPTIYSV